MRARVPLFVILGLLLLFTRLRPAAAHPQMVALLPSQGTAGAVTPAPPSETTQAADKPTARKPLYRRWWLWTIVGVVVGQGVVAGAILATRSEPTFVPTIPSIQAASGLVRF